MAPHPDASRRPRIYVDADACPFKDVILEVAAAHGFGVTMIANYCHVLPDNEEIERIAVDKERDAVDFAIANRVAAGDIVVTQDYGLAALVLGKGARALSPRGLLYTAGNIDKLLDERYFGQKARRAGNRTKGPSRLTPDDREHFRQALAHLAAGLE